MSNKLLHGFLRWKAPGKVPSVQLDFSVIERMTVDVMRGFGVTRRRGTEIGGVLLGKIKGGDEPVVSIFDYETVPCEYSEGPSYVLSHRDRELFRDVAARWTPVISPDQYVVGYFRSHTRDGLEIDQIDVRQFHQYIDSPSAVALLVKPYATRAADAGFFLQSGGKLDTVASPLEFQFVRAEQATPSTAGPVVPAARPRPIDHLEEADKKQQDTRQEESKPKPVLSPAPAAPVSQSPRVAGVESEPVRREPGPAADVLFSTYYPTPVSTWKTRALWVAFALAVFGFGTVAGHQYAGVQLPIRQGTARAQEIQTSPADLYSIKLSAVAQNESVLVKWDRDSGPVKTAQRGMLTIIEGTASKEVKLGAADLQNGTVLYHKAGSEVTFRLDVFHGNTIITESVSLRLAAPSAGR